MSALLGLVDFADPVPAHWRTNGLAAMLPAARGRDGEWRSDHAVLAWRGFVVTPQDRAERQPMLGGDGRLAVLFDGRLDERESLADLLGLPARGLDDMPDGLLFLRAFEAWGSAAFARLHGDFACAVWNDRERRLVLGCDAMGARPLVYRRDGTAMRFASRPGGLFADPDVPRDFDEDNLTRVCGRMSTDPAQTIYRNVFAVPGGTHVLADRDGIRIVRHWRPADVKPFTLPSEADYVDAFHTVLNKAIADRMRSAKPVASHLSAGFDSSSVTVLAARQLAASGKRLLAYTAAPAEGFRQSGGRPGMLLDESVDAARVAALHPNIEHRIVRAGERSPMDGFDRFRLGADMPPRNPVHMVWLDAIAQDAARQGVGVLLHASAGNATISYDGLHQLAHLVLRGRLVAAFREARGVRVEYGSYRLQVEAVARALAQRFGLSDLLRRAPGGRRLVRGLTGRSNLNRLARMTMPVRLEREAASRRQTWKDAWFDRRAQEDGGYRASLILRPFSAALAFYDEAVHGIAPRDPTADRRVVEFCWGAPLSVWLRQGRTKYLTRKAMKALLPESVVESHRSARQAADYHVGLTLARDAMARELESIRQCALARDILDVEDLQRLIDDWPEGRWHDREVVLEYQAKLLNGLAAGHFIRRMTGSNA